ncbi:MAG: helix-turn-helix domain-containing protein [Lachnospiraceae bacterium]|nr:helix-turn-helix domain-containing protein [Lachnospiraceae bacterium]
MDLTLDMLYQALRSDFPHARLEQGSLSAPVRQILLHRGSVLLRKDVLYLRNNILCFDEQEKGRILFPGHMDELRIMEVVLECRDRLLEWDNRICEAILRRQPLEEVLDLAQPYLHYSYSLIDRDMHVFYESPYRPTRDRSLSESRGSEKELYVPEETIRMLMMERSFHESVLRKDSYYFRDSSIERNCYCRNIFVNGFFHARLVLFLPSEDSRLSRGEEQLFTHFALRVEQLIQSRREYQHLPSSDTLHGLCRALIGGETWDPSKISFALEKTDWNYHHPFLVLSFSFSERSPWQSGSELGLLHLVTEAEKMWHGSISFPTGGDALCVMDLRCTYPGKEGNAVLSALRSDLAVFVREHVCLAGVSAVCTDISGIPGASRQARAARDIGSRENPDRWYCLFDEHRVDYAVDILRREALPVLGQNPLLRLLAEHDRLHNTEYVATLRAYLKCQLNMQAAADSLFIHRTSFCRRMDRIRQIAGMNILTPDRIFELEMALRIE